MVLASRRPRTVLGCLVACRDPVRPAGLGAGWLPGASWGGGFPGCGPGCRGGPGSRLGWPCRLLWGGGVPCRAAPGPVAEPASPDHQRCRVVTGRLRVVLPQRGEPVLGPPAGGVGGVDDDDCRPALAPSGPAGRGTWRWGCRRPRAGSPRPRLPREGRLPWRSRPSARASAKSRFSITIARAPCSLAVAMRALMAARSRPSRVAAGSPARSSGRVDGVPRTLPSAAMTATARCPALTSTATTGGAAGPPGTGRAGGGLPRRVEVPAVPCRVVG